MVNAIRRGWFMLILALWAATAGLVFGQAVPTQPAQPATGPAVREADELVVLDFPADGVELKTLTEIVTRRLNIPIIYDDESIRGKKVIIRVPHRVPESALLGILHSALRMKQLALVDAEQPGWKQIVAAQNLAAVAKPIPAGATPEPGAPLTQVIVLSHTDPARVVEAVRPLLTQPGGNVLPVPGQRMLIVSDYPSVVSRIEQIARLLDTEGPAVEIRFVPLREAEASAVVASVSQLLNSREAYLWGAPGASGVFLIPDERLNQVGIVAPKERMAHVVELISGMDRPQELVTRVYRLKSIAPERIDRLMKDLLGASARRAYQASIDEESQSLIVSATGPVQARVETLVRELDQPIAAEASPIRFYKLKNTKALDVLATIEGMARQRNGDVFGAENAQEPQSPPSTGQAAQPPGNPTNQPAEVPGQPPAPPPTPIGPLRDESQTRAPQRAPGYGKAPDQFAEAAEGPPSVRAPDATVTADVNTNSLIVIAPPAVQQLYAGLIERLDIRRPQVQIECTIVTLDTSDNFSLGVDVAASGGSGDDNSIITFSSFGVARLDPVAGTLTPTLGRGGTFALLSPGNADIVIRALSTNSRARLISAPSLLVNDNGRGQLKSVAQEPYAQIIDSTASQAITSFGGQAEAGTSILVEPHISQDDYLQLSYTIELSNFTGTAREGLPPPSQSNSVNSTVTIPDGYTIVVGGLSTKNFRSAVDSIPGIDQIPLLKYLFGTRTRTITDTTLFVFIRPVILRDDKFEDLKYISGLATDAASLRGDLPRSEPIPLR